MIRWKTSLATLTAVGVFAVGTLIGWNLLTADAEAGDAGPQCADRHVAAGEMLTANLVKVSVLNGSNRSGLGNRASLNLQQRGFLPGTIGNFSGSQIAVDQVAILTDDPEDPLVQLVAQQFQVTPQIAAPDIKVEADAVTIVLGQNYTDLNPNAVTEIAASRDVDVCVQEIVELDEEEPAA